MDPRVQKNLRSLTLLRLLIDQDGVFALDFDVQVVLRELAGALENRGAAFLLVLHGEVVGVAEALGVLHREPLEYALLPTLVAVTGVLVLRVLTASRVSRAGALVGLELEDLRLRVLEEFVVVEISVPEERELAALEGEVDCGEDEQEVGEG